jgi:galactose oxidase
MKCCICAEIWNPATEKFTVLAKMAEPRTYHSVALLLRDGRVFAGGGGLCGKCTTNHLNGQVFTPPNLFKADGSPASQPTITISKTMAMNGASFVVTANRGLKSVALVRLGSTTHSVNTDQRRIELCGPLSKACVASAGNKYTVKIPAQPGIAIPGNWMVFGIDAAGVPSKSQIIKIGSAAVGPLAAAKLAISNATLDVPAEMATVEAAAAFSLTPLNTSVLTASESAPDDVKLA